MNGTNHIDSNPLPTLYSLTFLCCEALFRRTHITTSRYRAFRITDQEHSSAYHKFLALTPYFQHIAAAMAWGTQGQSAFATFLIICRKFLLLSSVLQQLLRSFR